MQMPNATKRTMWKNQVYSTLTILLSFAGIWHEKSKTWRARGFLFSWSSQKRRKNFISKIFPQKSNFIQIFLLLNPRWYWKSINYRHWLDQTKCHLEWTDSNLFCKYVVLNPTLLKSICTKSQTKFLDYKNYLCGFTLHFTSTDGPVFNLKLLRKVFLGNNF